MKITHEILDNLKEMETFTFDPKIVAKDQAEYDKDKPKIRKEIENEYRELVRDLLKYGLSKEEIMKLPETKAYNDAIKDPEDIWCECSEDTESNFKPDGEVYLGVSKHAYICKRCKKYTQIG